MQRIRTKWVWSGKNSVQFKCVNYYESNPLKIIVLEDKKNMFNKQTVFNSLFQLWD